MTYRCGIGENMRALGYEPGKPGIQCDSCGAKHVINDRRPPPLWFLDGKAPRRWRVVRENGERIDTCPMCLEASKPAKAKGGRR